MRLSPLQQYILKTVYDRGGRVDREVFFRYYKSDKKPPNPVIQTKVITKSLFRLIDKSLMLGFGYRTQHRWFLESVELTPNGKKEAAKFFGEQQELPLTRKRKQKK